MMKWLGIFLSTAWLFGATPEPPPERQCTLRVAWWSQPTESFPIAVLQGKEIIPIVPLEMNLDLTKDYRGSANLTLLRKKPPAAPGETTAPTPTPAPAPAKGEPKGKTTKERPEDWELLTNVTLPDANDVGILLFMNPAKACEARAFDYDLRRFPYGALRLINLTKYPLQGVIDRTNFQAAPGITENLPITYHERTVSHIEINATPANAPITPVFATKMVGRPNYRTLIFILESPHQNLDGTPQFESRSISSIQPIVPEEVHTPEAKNKKSK